MYQIGLLKSAVSSIPVIVVGNIYIGGNGKTPFVVWLIEQLKEAGYKPGVVSRGYGSRDSDAKGNSLSWPRCVDSKAEDVLSFGDEPFLIHKLTSCPVVIDPIRPRAVAKIVEDTDCDVIISDDGLQHYAMSRYIEINITDANRLYGNQLCLPAGPLRERKSRLNSVDYIVYNISRGCSDTLIKNFKDNEFSMDYEVSSLSSLTDPEKQSMTLSDLKGKIVHAVAGIGEPGQFFWLLRNHGIEVIEHPFADHFQYKMEDFIFDKPYPIIMTEKDAVKCPFFLLDDALSDVWYLPIKARVSHNLFNKIDNQLKSYKII